MSQCKAKTEVYSRIVGYFRPVQQWNPGKKEEYFHRKTFQLNKPDSEILEFPMTDDVSTAEVTAVASAT